MKYNITAGSSITDISPEKGVELAGYPHCPRHNTGINDPLYASCLYLENRGTGILIISLDILFISKKYVCRIRKNISAATGIPEKNISICCTHTHSGPWASGRLDFEALENELEPDHDYIENMIRKVSEAGIKAYKERFTASAGTGKGLCGKERGVGGNRRDPDGPADPEVRVMGVKDESGRVRVCIVNYALHPTFLHAENTLVSADYPGYIREFLKEKFPDAVMLFLQGFAGDQSSRYFRKGQSFGEAQRVGHEIGKKAAEIINTIEYKNTAAIRTLSEEVEIKLRKFPCEDEASESFNNARREYTRLKEANAPYIELQNANVKMLGAEDLLGYIIMLRKGKRIDLYEDEKPAEILTVTIDGISMVFMPGEIFVEYGLQIKNAFPEREMFMASVSNGCLPGYVYTREALEEGGYEADTSMLSADMGELMTNKSIKMLRMMEI